MFDVKLMNFQTTGTPVCVGANDLMGGVATSSILANKEREQYERQRLNQKTTSVFEQHSIDVWYLNECYKKINPCKPK